MTVHMNLRMRRITNEAYRMIEGNSSTGLNHEIDPLKYQNILLKSYYRCLGSIQLDDIVLSRVSWVVVVNQEQSGVTSQSILKDVALLITQENMLFVTARVMSIPEPYENGPALRVMIGTSWVSSSQIWFGGTYAMDVGSSWVLAPSYRRMAVRSVLFTLEQPVVATSRIQ